MTATTAGPGIVGFSLRVPPGWFEFDLWRASRSRDLARHVDERIARHPVLAPRRGALLRFLRGVGADAERRGAVYCAAMAEPVGAAGHLVASCMVVQTSGPDPDRVPTPASIAAAITARPALPGAAGWREVHLVDLPAGPAVRVREVAAVDLGPAAGRGAAVEHLVMHTLLPRPDGLGVVDVVLASPQVRLCEPMTAVFAAISGTFGWLPAPQEGTSDE